MTKFIKYIVGTLCCLIMIQCPILASYDSVKAVGESYVAFMHNAGQSDTPVTSQQVSQIFNSNCEKIENGAVLFSSSNALPDQLKNARDAVGKWTITPLFMTSSPQDNTCTIQFIWNAEKVGEHTTMVVLFLDDQGKIIKIREVYNVYLKKLV